MRIVFPAAALLIAAAPAPQAAQSGCEKVAATTVAASGSAPTVHTLGAEPPARQIKAVDQPVAGCRKPIVVRAEVGTRQR